MNDMMTCLINCEKVTTTQPAGTVTLDFIRHQQKQTGAKEGCREGECGACSILLGEFKDHQLIYKTVASCLLPLGEVAGKHVVTIEGINFPKSQKALSLTPVQQALLDEGASQCGFCTPGFVIALTGFFLNSPNLTYEDAIKAMDGNMCRCTGYVSIQRAARKLCDTFAPQLQKDKERIEQLVEWQILPDYFLQIPALLKEIAPHHRAHTPHETDVLIAGATDLYVQKPEELQEKELVFLSRRSHFNTIKQEGYRIIMGAGTTVTEFKESSLLHHFFPSLSTYLNLVSSTLMRNRATLAGNIVNASPIGDISIMLLALQARLHLNHRQHHEKQRQVPLKDFFKGYKQIDLLPGEIIEAISIPIPESGTRFHFEKVSRRKYLDIASCNSALSLSTDGTIIHDIYLSAGGVAPMPLFLAKTRSFLVGKELSISILKEALTILAEEINPISDVRGSALYKKKLLERLFWGHFIELCPQLNLVEELL